MTLDLAAAIDGETLTERLGRLDERLRSLGSVVVAFSGGADSAFLLAAAVRSLGPANVVAATAVSSSLPESELRAAQDFARNLGVRHLTPATHEMDRDGYRANGGDRCYFCKAELVDVLAPIADELSIDAVATGTNADDARAGFRPGIRAASERGAVTPLLDAGLTKAQVRQASRDWGLATWDKPAAACLSSRIAFGIEVTPRRLARVERAELAARAWLEERAVTLTDLRVRDLGTTARIELDQRALAALLDAHGPDELLATVRDVGFAQAELDPKGFRSGAMNELLGDPARYR